MTDAKPKTTHTITLTDEEVFVLMIGIEQVCDIRDGEYAKVRQIANDLSGRLPRVPTKWQDVSA